MDAEHWRFSIDVNHRSPAGSGRNPKYFNGKPFSPEAALICKKLKELKDGLADSPFGGLKIVKDIECLIEDIIADNCAGEIAFL